MSSSSTETDPDVMNVEKNKPYPKPIVSHEEIVKNPSLFMDTLKQFHSVMGTRFMVPIFGGKQLNLHTLYVEVTKRGGFLKVVKDKKWREVGNVFRFGPTVTSASYVLKKHYLNLIHKYEQTHFKLQDPSSKTPTVAMPVNKSSTCKGESYYFIGSSSRQIQTEEKTKSFPDSKVGATVVGTVDAKFEDGYLVTMKFRSETLRGVVFRRPEFHSSSSSSSSSALTESATVPITPNPPPYYVASTASTSSKRRKRRTKKARFEDPAHPKPNRSGYNFYFAEKHSRLKILCPNNERDFTRIIGHSWTNLEDEEKEVYQKKGLEDKERYKREMKEYKENLKVLQSSNETYKMDLVDN